MCIFDYKYQIIYNHIFNFKMRYFSFLTFCSLFVLISIEISAQSPVSSFNTKVLSFNVRMSHGNDGINKWENRTDLILKTLDEINVDVIGMQEVTSEQFLFFKENLKNYSFYGVGRKDGKLEDEIMAIFYNNKYELLMDSTIWLSETPAVIGSKSWDAALYRTVSWLKLKDKESGIQWMFYNTHFDHRGVQAREESAKVIMKLIADTNHGLPAVLLGDFNITKEQKPYEILTSSWKGCYQLKDARSITESPHKGGEITATGFKDNYGKIIDFIFVSDGIKVKSHQYLNVKEGEIFISDHYPVEAELKITDKKIKPNSGGESLE